MIMTKKEFATFAMALQTYYPREQLLPNKQAMELWYMQLKDIPLPIAQIALQKWVATNKWSPSISEIFGLVEKIHWEAYQMISTNLAEHLSEEDRKQFQWIYEVTKPYKMAKIAEPPLGLFINNNGPLQIGPGGGGNE